ncbi:MAG: endonuclease/exonuclease/phosphatase family protein [Burkholderiaceae bacterium]|jgi:endonuclease/exonuclease/phosphatase family metal-dependent hydrolase|nr:endonuclease/exonuclease/phosphatase family protein [Burkholderiaceae bacterium]
MSISSIGRSLPKIAHLDVSPKKPQTADHADKPDAASGQSTEQRSLAASAKDKSASSQPANDKSGSSKPANDKSANNDKSVNALKGQDMETQMVNANISRAMAQYAANQLASGSDSADDKPPPGTNSLRVMTLNVGGGADNLNCSGDGMDSEDVDGLAERITNQKADVAMLQEVWQEDVEDLESALEAADDGSNWTLYYEEASEKTRCDADAEPTPGVPADPYGPPIPRAGYSYNESYGNLIAVRESDGGSKGNVAQSRRIGDGKNEDGQKEGKLDRKGDDGSDGRMAVKVRVTTTDGAEVDFTTAHIDNEEEMDPGARAEQIEKLREFAEKGAGGRPVIIAGDFNLSIDPGENNDQAGRALSDYIDVHGYTDAGNAGPTSKKGHDRRLDYIFTNGEVVAKTPKSVQGDSPFVRGEDNNLSDHDGIAVTVEVPAPEKPAR